MLARLAVSGGARAGGRQYPEPEHPYRNAFRRDRDRVVHSRAFRRLEAKTQVFTPGLSDHFRNRLTHTIEVAQIARTVANVLGLDEDLTEALALAHDIGHPPFAHAGEEELNRQMARFGERFDHNLHALRIVERFEQRYARFPGLNLTLRGARRDRQALARFRPGEHPELDAYPARTAAAAGSAVDRPGRRSRPITPPTWTTPFPPACWPPKKWPNACPDTRPSVEAVETQFPGATAARALSRMPPPVDRHAGLRADRGHRGARAALPGCRRVEDVRALSASGWRHSPPKRPRPAAR